MKNDLRLIRMLLVTLLGATLASCYSYDADDHSGEQPNYVNVNIYVPRATVATRGDEGTIAGDDAENALKQTYIWIYENASGATALPIAFVEKDLSTVTPTDGVYTVQVPLPITTVTDQKNVDVFVLANAAAISSTANLPANKKNISRGSLLEVYFGKTDSGDDFGTTTPTGAADIAANGLPMSEYILNANIYNSSNVIAPAGVTLPLKRAVSKIRFVFARQTGYDDVSIQGITINGDAIPNSECVFPAHTANTTEDPATVDRTPNLPAGVTYDATAITYNTTELPAACIMESDNPDNLRFRALSATETGPQYIARLDAALTAAITDATNLATARTYGLTYLRETDRQISGIISYRLPGDAEGHVNEKTFTLETPYDFTRNHYYVVYGYFSGQGDLNLVNVYISSWGSGGSGSHDVYNW